MKITILVTRIVALLAVAVLAAPFVWEKVTGDYFMTVTGGSMRPTYQVGDVLVVQRPTGSDLSHPGQPVVVAFTPGDKGTQYVHRVHELVIDGAVLKGDNNDVADPTRVTEAHVMGTPRAALSGRLASTYHFTQSWVTRASVAAFLIAALFLPRRRSPSHAVEKPVPDELRTRAPQQRSHV